MFGTQPILIGATRVRPPPALKYVNHDYEMFYLSAHPIYVTV